MSMKTNKAIAKRFKKTARGKILFARPGKSHLNGHKSRKRKRHLRKAAQIGGLLGQAISIQLG